MRFLILCCSLLGWHSSFVFAGDTPSDPRWVETVQVATPSLERWQLTGTLQPRYQFSVSFRVAGQVEQRSVELGELVKKGQVLAILDQTDLKLSVEQAKANLASARSNMENTARESQRLAKLYRDKLISLQQLQRAETYETESRQSVIAAKAALKLAQNQLNYSVLKSPVTGTVSQVLVEVGQMVPAGQPVFQVVSELAEAEVFLPANRIVSDIQSASLTGVDHPGQCQASLRAKSPLNSSSGLQYQARYQLLHCSDSLPLGSVVQLHFQTEFKHKQQLPITAVFNKGKHSYVWLIEDQHVTAKPVTVTQITNENAIIEADLKERAQVVKQGTHALVEGQAVRVRP
ncbi:MAG: hypothetical protein DSZ27_06580 [Thiomicrospira sp.]|nr:MAG: hypothetical protein DSZ27_06580 [Thiomicrospira sp.]